MRYSNFLNRCILGIKSPVIECLPIFDWLVNDCSIFLTHVIISFKGVGIDLSWSLRQALLSVASNAAALFPPRERGEGNKALHWRLSFPLTVNTQFARALFSCQTLSPLRGETTFFVRFLAEKTQESGCYSSKLVHENELNVAQKTVTVWKITRF